jgi:hypothetical protein
MSAASDLSTIRTKVRRVTGRLSPAEMSDNLVDFYINTYLMYDFPEQIRSRILQTTYRFTTNAFQDTYEFPSEQYVLMQGPLQCDGYYLNYYQNQELFYAAWPKIFFLQTVAIGNGATTNPALANLSALPALANQVMVTTSIAGETVSYTDDGQGSFLSEGFTIIGITNTNPAIVTLATATSGIVAGDQVFISNVFGMTQINGGPYLVTAAAGASITINVDATIAAGFSPFQTSPGSGMQKQSGTVNYQTGAIALDWGSPPDNGAQINAHYYTYKASRPNSLLFWGNEMVFRPVPDQGYLIEIPVYKKPVELLANSQSPELRQWWQLISYGAALKIFADSLDMESYQKCSPLFQEQEILAMRSTVDQKSQKKVITPFSDAGGPQTYPYDFFGY